MYNSYQTCITSHPRNGYKQQLLVWLLSVSHSQSSSPLSFEAANPFKGLGFFLSLSGDIVIINLMY